jgi:hypothetical protein
MYKIKLQLFRLNKMSDPKQIWVGSIPEYLDEAGAILEMRAYNIRPWKLVLRSRGEGKDCHHLHTTTCVWCLRYCECVCVCGMCVSVYANVDCTSESMPSVLRILITSVVVFTNDSTSRYMLSFAFNH